MIAIILALWIAGSLWIVGSLATAAYAVDRGYPVLPMLFGSLFFSPVLVLLIVALVPSRIYR